MFTLENFLGYIETEQNCGVQKIVLQDFEKELLAWLAIRSRDDHFQSNYELLMVVLASSSAPKTQKLTVLATASLPANSFVSIPSVLLFPYINLVPTGWEPFPLRYLEKGNEGSGNKIAALTGPMEMMCFLFWYLSYDALQALRFAPHDMHAW